MLRRGSDGCRCSCCPDGCDTDPLELPRASLDELESAPAPALATEPDPASAAPKLAGGPAAAPGSGLEYAGGGLKRRCDGSRRPSDRWSSRRAGSERLSGGSVRGVEVGARAGAAAGAAVEAEGAEDEIGRGGEERPGVGAGVGVGEGAGRAEGEAAAPTGGLEAEGGAGRAGSRLEAARGPRGRDGAPAAAGDAEAAVGGAEADGRGGVGRA